jgi:hypothetical protein
MRQSRWLVLAALSLSGCISVSPQMQNVRITSNPDVVRGCKFLGNISFNGFWRTGPKDSENLLRKKVVELGGNVPSSELSRRPGSR